MANLLALLIFLLPVLITPGVLFHYDVTPKIILLTGMAAACALFPRRISIGVAALWRKRSGRLLCGLAALQALWYALAAALSTRPWFSLLGSNWRRMGLATVVALCAFAVLTAAQLSAKPESVSRMLRAYTAALAFASVYGILQYFDIDPLQAASAYHAEAGPSTIVRPPGTLGHADYFGWWLAIGIFCALETTRSGSTTWRWVGRAASILAGTAIVLSGTRSAILAVLAGFVTLALFTGLKPRKQHWIAGLAAVAILGAFFVSSAGTRLRARVRWSSDEPVGGARPLLWRDTLRMAAARPWTGFGPETFAAEFPKFQSIELARLLPDFYHESPHNTALDALTSEGIPGLMIGFAWIALGGLAALRARSGPGPYLAAALMASVVAGMFGAATIGPIFATLLVIAMMVARAPEDAATTRAPRPALVLAIISPIAAGLVLFAFLLARADFALARFQHASGDTAVEIARYEAVTQAALPGAGEDLYASRLLAKLCGAGADHRVQAACVAGANIAANRATSTADNPPNAWYNLAMFSAEQNDASKVEVSLRTALSLAPNWFKPHWSLANLLAVTGRRADAQSEAERALFLDAGKDGEVRRTVQILTQPLH